jgi:hypothetical protein
MDKLITFLKLTKKYTQFVVCSIYIAFIETRFFKWQESQ